MAVVTNESVNTNITIKNTTRTVNVFSGPYNQHNHLVRNARSVTDDNTFLDESENQKLFLILPFGGGESCCGDCPALMLWYFVYFGGIVSLIATIITALFVEDVSGSLRQWLVWTLLFMLFAFCSHVTCLVLLFINYHRFQRIRGIIPVKANIIMQHINEFYEISTSSRRGLQFIAADHQEAIMGHIISESASAFTIMVYSQDYISSQVNRPRNQLISAMIISFVSFIFACVSLGK